MAARRPQKNTSEERELFGACRDGNLEKVKHLYNTHKKGARDHDNYERSPLHWAARHGHYDVIVYLVKNGAAINYKDRYGDTPLHEAAGFGYESIVSCLCEQDGVSINEKDNDGWTPLHLAVLNDHLPVVKHLCLQEATDPSAKDGHGWTSLHWAAREGRESVVAYLCQQEGVNVNEKNNRGDTPLHLAARHGYESIVRCLCEQDGVSINEKDKEGWTPLHLAAREGRESVVAYLCQQEGININEKSNSGRTPLHLAAEDGYESIVSCLCEQDGVSINEKDNDGWTPLHLAVQNGKESIVTYLCHRGGVSINEKNNRGETPLHLAADTGRESIVAYLCQQEGINVNEKTNSGWTPLHLAARNGHLRVVKHLCLQEATDLSAKDDDGWTSLHWAARNGCTNVLKYLLTEGHCDPNCTTNDGETPLAMARDTEIIRLLLQHGARTTELYKYSHFLPDGSPRQAAQSTVPLFMTGDKGAGKSTLTKALKTEKGRFSRLAAQLIQVGGVKDKTAGIECHQIHSTRVGSLTIFDLAGHREFHGAHDTVIRSAVSGPSSGIFVLVIDLTESEDELKRTIHYWLSFIKNQVPESSQIHPPTSMAHLLVVGSHGDAVKSKGELRQKQSTVRHICESVEKLHFVDCVTVDCRYSESSALDQVRTHLLESQRVLQYTSAMAFHVHCFHVYVISKCGDKPGLQLGELFDRIQHDMQSTEEMMFCPRDLSSLKEVCSDLSRRGIMTYIEKKPEKNSWIIIDRDMLLREINGTLFAPKDFLEHKDLTYTGVVPSSKLCEVFKKIIDSKKLNPELLFNFMSHMEFCQEITEEDIIKLVKQHHSQYKEEHHFLFPALTSPTPPDDLWKPQPDITYTSGWVLQCCGHQDYLSPRFLQVLLLRLTFTHALPVDTHRSDLTHRGHQQECSIWRNGVKWTSTSAVDVLVEITDHQVTLLLRCEEHEELSLIRMRAQVINEILKAKKEFCPSTKTVELFAPNPQYPVSTELAVSSSKLAFSLCQHEKFVLLKPHTTVRISNLLYFEPYSYLNKQCLEDLYHAQFSSCVLTPQFVECAASNVVQCATDFCKVFNHFCTVLNVPPHKVAVDGGSSDYHKAEKMFDVWRTTNQGTYQRLREEIDQYSVFCGRNIFEIANIVPTPPTSTELDIPTEQQQQHCPAAIETRVNQSKLDTKPTLLELEVLSNTEGLKIRVMEQVAADWDNLAIFLQFSQHVIEIIQRDHHNQAERACREVFQRWLKGANATWRVLLQALEDMEKQTLASDLRKLL